MAERYRCEIERTIDAMITLRMSEQDIKAVICKEYRPYDTLPEFQEGFDAYQKDGALRAHPYDGSPDSGGFRAQAYDRGANAAMWLQRARQRMKTQTT